MRTMATNKMADKKAALNRAASPMTYREELAEDPFDVAYRKKPELKVGQTSRTPFLIGTIEDVSRWIGNLEQHLNGYQGLVSDTGQADLDLCKCRISSADAREDYQKKEKENMEINQFAGIYAIKSTFSKKQSERAKHVSKISMTGKENNIIPKLTGSAVKPIFVELHHYPGFDTEKTTRIPHVKSVESILHRVVLAQKKISDKSPYKKLFDKWLFLKPTQEILEDTYWWIFIDKWHVNKSDQPLYFNRVSHNYVKLLSLVEHPQYRERFLIDIPMLISQGVYAAYCESFPDSFRLFVDDFKEFIIRLVHEWMTGICPSPRLWQKWNMHKLEPAGIRERDEMMNNMKKKTNTSMLYLEMLNTKTPFAAQELPKIVISGSQVNPSDRTLSTIRDSDEDTKQTSYLRLKPVKRESHPIGRGAEFLKTVFNVNGQSPLVLHYLQQKNCVNEAGITLRLQRTEVASLPPLDSVTYRDIIKESLENQYTLQKKWKKLYSEGERKHSKFARRQTRIHKDLEQRQKLLLANKLTVKTLADIILLEMTKDKDSVSAKMHASIERALKAQKLPSK